MKKKVKEETTKINETEKTDEATLTVSLQELELLKIKNNNLNETISLLKIKQNNERKLLIDTRIELLNSQIKSLTQDKKNLDVFIQDLEKTLYTIKDERKEFLNTLKEKYRLPDKWGYDPDTGVITTE